MKGRSQKNHSVKQELLTSVRSVCGPRGEERGTVLHGSASSFRVRRDWRGRGGAAIRSGSNPISQEDSARETLRSISASFKGTICLLFVSLLTDFYNFGFFLGVSWTGESYGPVLAHSPYV